MAIKRPKPEEIVVKLRQVEVLIGQGMPRIDAIRQIGVTEQTYYRWKKKYGGMGAEQLKELKRLQKENERLRRAVSDPSSAAIRLIAARLGARGTFPVRGVGPSPQSGSLRSKILYRRPPSVRPSLSTPPSRSPASWTNSAGLSQHQ